MSDESSNTARSVTALSMLLLLIGLGIAELATPGSDRQKAPVDELSTFPTGAVQTVYGLTPIDLGLVAGALAETPPDPDQRYLVAGYPGFDKLQGPVLTSLANPEFRLPDGDLEKLPVVPTGQGWKRLSPTDDERAGSPRLTNARVHLETADGQKTCPRIGPARFACRGPGWAHVREKKVRVDGNNQPCIWSHPLEGATTVIDFGPVAPADKDSYRLETALHDDAAGEPGDVDLAVEFGEHQIEHTHRSEKGWQQRSLPTIDQPQPLSIAVSAERVGRRHFCFRIE